jgi:hypothetical protein
MDTPIEDYVISVMRDFEAIENIEILGYKIVKDQDMIDINNHMININYKKKDLDNIEVPKYKYITPNRYGEIIFTIKIHTNLNEKIITKRILIPIEYEGMYLNNGKKMKAIWQMVDASTYSQRGKLTLKARMPIVVYHNKHRITEDINGTQFVLQSYSYALDTSSKRKGGGGSKKKKAKFINPLMIYSAKMGFAKTVDFFGMKGIVSVKSSYTKEDEEDNYIFALNDIFVIADKYLFDKYALVSSFVCMVVGLFSRDFPVTITNLEDREYWVCRIGYLGASKNKNIISFREKGTTTIYMIERLLNETTIKNLRLPMIYKNSIYYLIYWLITNFESLKQRNNIAMDNKRIRKNEYMVLSSLGKKVSENINKLIERKSKSKLNTMDTLLELFNFNSDIIVSSMRNNNDLIKSDDQVNDMTFLLDLAFSSKGPNSMGESSSKMIAAKYRYLSPSMVGVQDIFTTSNSDCGMSGAFTPFVELYNGFYFTPDSEPCDARYQFDKALVEDEHKVIEIDVTSFESYTRNLEEKAKFAEDLKYEPIEIVEKEKDA